MPERKRLFFICIECGNFCADAFHNSGYESRRVDIQLQHSALLLWYSVAKIYSINSIYVYKIVGQISNISKKKENDKLAEMRTATMTQYIH